MTIVDHRHDGDWREQILTAAAVLDRRLPVWAGGLAIAVVPVLCWLVLCQAAFWFFSQ